MGTGRVAIRLRKEINLPYASAIMIGIIIGSGIFVSPVSFTRHCGSVGASLIMWVLSGFLSLGIALCFTELGAIYPAAGGEYAFFRNILGRLPAFLDAWMHFVIVQPCFYALLGLTTTDYIFSALKSMGCGVPHSASTLSTVWIIVTVCAINSVYVRYVQRVQAIFTVCKLLALLVIIGTGIYQLAMGKVEILNSGFEGTNTDPGGYAVSLHSGVFTYMGWQYIFFLLEEVKEPERIVPRATVLSFAVVIVVYALTNVAYFTVMTPTEMIQSKAVAMDFAKKTLGPLAAVVPFFVAVSTIGALNGAILGGSRIYFAAARDGLFPGIVSTIHMKYMTPWPALFSVCLLSVLYVLTGSAVTLLEYLGFSASLTMCLCVSGLLYLRWKKPDIPRPIKVPIALPIVIVLILTSMVVMALYHQPRQNGIGVLLILSGIPVYLFGVCCVPRIRALSQLMGAVTQCLQKTMMVLPTEDEF